MAPVRYDLAVASWRSSQIISVVSGTGNPIGYFPVDFIMKGGHPEWAYVLLAVQQLVDRPLSERWELEGADGQPVSLEGTPRAGKYIYRCQGESRL